MYSVSQATIKDTLLEASRMLLLGYVTGDHISDIESLPTPDKCEVLYEQQVLPSEWYRLRRLGSVGCGFWWRWRMELTRLCSRCRAGAKRGRSCSAYSRVHSKYLAAQVLSLQLRSIHTDTSTCSPDFLGLSGYCRIVTTAKVDDSRRYCHGDIQHRLHPSASWSNFRTAT
jgi:hypothetical protein